MPRFAASHRAAATLPATLPHGAIEQAHAAARSTARRLGVVPPVAQMGLRALRDHVRAAHTEHRAKGGVLGLPELAPLSRAELEDVLRNLKGVRSL